MTTCLSSCVCFAAYVECRQKAKTQRCDKGTYLHPKCADISCKGGNRERRGRAHYPQTNLDDAQAARHPVPLAQIAGYLCRNFPIWNAVHVGACYPRPNEKKMSCRERVRASLLFPPLPKRAKGCTARIVPNYSPFRKRNRRLFNRELLRQAGRRLATSSILAIVWPHVCSVWVRLFFPVFTQLHKFRS